METKQKAWVGADPGGSTKKAFGLACLFEDGKQPFVGCFRSANGAFDCLMKIVEVYAISGAGIDAPMWWSAGELGLRKADEFAGGLKLNSLRGACLVQGRMFAMLLRNSFPELPITETHPKRLIETRFWIQNHSEELNKLLVLLDCKNDHEKDALISAVAAREGFSKKWSSGTDLSDDRHKYEEGFGLKPIAFNYFWPEVKRITRSGHNRDSG